MNKYERLLAKIGGSGDSYEIKGTSLVERLLKSVSQRANKTAEGFIEYISTSYISLTDPKKSAVAITPDSIQGVSNSVLFEGDSGGAVILANIHDPVANNQAATKGYVDPRLLPVATAEDVGKVVKVDAEGHYYLANA